MQQTTHRRQRNWLVCSQASVRGIVLCVSERRLLCWCAEAGTNRMSVREREGEGEEKGEGEGERVGVSVCVHLGQV